MFESFVVHVVPALILVKGLWNEKPPDWPADVPYKDPNNGEKISKLSFLFKCLDKFSHLIRGRMPIYLIVIVIESRLRHVYGASLSKKAVRVANRT